MEDFCKNRIHEERVYTVKMEMKKEYKRQTPLDSDLCKDCLQKVIDWKKEKPSNIDEKDFDKRELFFAAVEQGVDVKGKIKEFFKIT